MSESDSHPPFIKDQKKEKVERYLTLAEALIQQPEGFSFPGVDEETRKILIEVDEQYPGYTTPTDEIISRMQREGIKIVVGNHPNSGNVFVLPLLSDDIEKDSLFPRHLVITPDMDESLRSLILNNKASLNTEREEVE